MTLNAIRIILMAVSTILLAPVGTSQVLTNDLEQNLSRWTTSDPQDPASLGKLKPEKLTPARVRLGLKLTPFHKVVNIVKGKKQTQFVPENVLRHTLRARLNKINHFFVSDFHIETRPIKWIKKTRKYEIKISIFQRHGAFGQLEEKIGSVNLSGILEEQNQNVYILYGSTAKRFRNKFRQPVLDLVAGFRPGETVGARSAARAPQPRPTPRKAPTNTSGSKIRGRF